MSQDLSRAAQPLPQDMQSVSRPPLYPKAISPGDSNYSAEQKTYVQATLHCPFSQPSAACPPAGSLLGTSPILFPTRTLKTSVWDPHLTSLTQVLVLKYTETQSSLGFCWVLIFLFLRHSSVFLSKVYPLDLVQWCVHSEPPHFPECRLSSQWTLLSSVVHRCAPSLAGYWTSACVSGRFSSSFSPRLSIPMTVTGGTLLSAGSAVRVGVEQYRIKPTMMTLKDRM